MYKSSDPSYSAKFETHVRKFMAECGFLKNNTRLVVAVSGGLDSMALLHCLSRLQRFGYSCELVGVHINHGTRKEQMAEAEMAKKYCESLDVKFESVTLEGLNPYKNFEFEARKSRYESLRAFVNDGDYLVLGHHIDDSFEWTILQSLRSSNLESSLGIPVRNGNIIRPFMCVTKVHIKRYIEAYDLPYLEDPTNEYTRYERNYIRAQISEGFSKRYPSYLKHYARRHNELARRLGKHISLKDQSDFSSYYGKDSVEILSFEGVFNPSGLEYKILQAMNYLVPNSRGVLSEQISKIIKAMRNNKGGPFTLTKGVKVYISHNHLLLCSKSYKTPDEKMAKELSSSVAKYLYKEFELVEFQKLLKAIYSEKSAECSFPLLVHVRSKRFNMEGMKKHELWPSLSQVKKQGLSGELIPAVKLLKYWAKPKNRNKKLSLRLLLPL